MKDRFVPPAVVPIFIALLILAYALPGSTP